MRHRHLACVKIFYDLLWLWSSIVSSDKITHDDVIRVILANRIKTKTKHPAIPT